MSNIFDEVDEEVRRERLQKLWERYSLFIIGAAVLLVAGIGAWRGYEYWEAKKAAAAGKAFEAAATLSDAGKHADAEAAFAKVATDAPAGYRALARMRAANELAEQNPKDAVKAYDDIAADNSVGQSLQDVAAIRAGMLLVDSAPLAELRRRLDPLSEPGRPFRSSARELLAFSAWRNGDATTAKRFIDMINADSDTPPGTRQRIEMLSALIAANGKS